MPNIKITAVIILFLLSFACYAGDTMWKQSQRLEEKGDYEQAASVIEHAAKTDNEYAVLRYAYLKYKQGEYNDSIEYYNKAIKLNAKSLDAKLGITLPYIAQGRWRQVKVYTRQVLTKSDWDYTAHERLMMAEDGDKKWHSLGRHSGKLTTIYPTDATTLAYHARAKARLGNTPVASAEYKKVLMREPDHAEANEYLENN
jgi:tetratricopeptide (TPR) repeat protein